MAQNQVEETQVETRVETRIEQVEAQVEHEYSEIVRNIKYSKNILINGSVQSGKTNLIIQLAFYSYELGYDVLILVNNFHMDLKQIEYRLNNYIIEHKKDKIVKILDKKIIPKSFTHRGIYVTLCNKSRVSAINNNYKPTGDFITIVDESDIFNQNVDKIENNSLNGISKELITLFNKTKSIIRITATSFSHVFINDLFPLKNSDIYFTENGPNYISFGHEKFNVIPFEDPADDQTILEDDDDDEDEEASAEAKVKDKIKLYLSAKKTSWTDQERAYFIKLIQEDREYFISKNIKPFIVVNVTPTIANHHYIKEVVQEHFYNVTVILVDEGLVKLSQIEQVKTLVEQVEQVENLMYFDSIQECLTFVQTEIHKHDTIVMITCKQLGRGISTRSQKAYFKDISTILYANSMIYACSDTKSMDEIIQSSLRIGGQFPGYEKIDGFELRLHTSNDIIYAMVEQFNWFNEIIENIKNSPDNKVTEVIPSLDKKPERKPISASRGKFICRKIGNSYECTLDKINISLKLLNITDNVDSFKTKSFAELTLIERIKKIVFINEKPMTYLEIATKGNELNAWVNSVVADGQLERTVSSLLSKAYENKKIHRKYRQNKNIYEYSLIP